MKVLIGVDASAHAEITLVFVCRIPWPADTKVVICSAVRPPSMAYVSSENEVAVERETSAWLEVLTRVHEDLVSRSAQKLASVGLHAEGRVLQGDPREALLEEVRKERADLLVVGSHGRTGLEKLLMGSVASHVVTHAPCSVLVVKR